MQKNWYAVYTKPHYEKKVASLFTKRKIENFCPLNCVKIQSFMRGKTIKEPLFKSYVFVNLTLNEITQIKGIDGVISLLYWMGKPAIIKEDEIDAIREFNNNHQNIELERTHVNTNDTARIVDAPSYSMDGKVFALKNKTVKVYLPSLGYIMVAKMEEESIFARDTTLLQNNSFSHSQ
jgi:transcription antitermination factor NusG